MLNLLNLPRIILANILAMALWPLLLRNFAVCKAFSPTQREGKMVMADKDQVENLHKKGRFCICAETMVEFLDPIGFLWSSKFNRFRRIATRIDLPTLTDTYPFVTDELFAFLAHFCSRRGWVTRMERALSILQREWSLIGSVDYTVIESLVDTATRNGSYAVTKWFAKQTAETIFKTTEYLEDKHLFNVINRCVEMKTLCEEDEHLVQWILDELSIQQDWGKCSTQMYPKIQNIAIGVQDLRIKSRIIRWGLSFPEWKPTDELIRHVIEDLDPKSATAEDMAALMWDSVNRNDGAVYLELDDSRPMATIVHNVLKLHEIPF